MPEIRQCVAMQLSESYQSLHDRVSHRRPDHAELIETNSTPKYDNNVFAVVVIFQLKVLSGREKCTYSIGVVSFVA